MELTDCQKTLNLMAQKTTKTLKDNSEIKLDSRVIKSIEEALEQKGLNPVDLARALKYDDSWASHLMKGRRGLSVNQLIEIAEILDVKPESLLPGEKSPETLEDFIKAIANEAYKENMEDLKKFIEKTIENKLEEVLKKLNK